MIGAGVGGMSAAIHLLAQGTRVTLLERASRPGGKLRTITLGGHAIDAGPTVLTLSDIFEQLFHTAGANLSDYITLQPLHTLARHAWPAAQDGRGEVSQFDLYTDRDRTADAIAAFAGSHDARGYLRFCEYTRKIYERVEAPFMRSTKPSVLSVVRDHGLSALMAMVQVDFHRTMWRALGSFFKDQRLRQLFARYATYYGSSPFQAPATLNLIAHVEREGVWTVKGGMIELARALEKLILKLGGELRCDCEVAEILVEGGRACGVRLRSGEQLRADVVVCNADAAAVASGLLGADARVASPGARSAVSTRSLSAITFAMVARTRGFKLAHHNVFFSRDYEAEFRELDQLGRPPTDPTVYVCAQSRRDGDEDDEPRGGGERSAPEPEPLLCLVNAPARGDEPRARCRVYNEEEIEECRQRSWQRLRECGLELQAPPPGESPAWVTTSPRDWNNMFPGTGGALYGGATHGWTASFKRPPMRTKLPGLYLVGGSAHPGAGLPMVTLGGALVARQITEDLASTARSRRAVTSGGMSTGSATTASTPSA